MPINASIRSGLGAEEAGAPGDAGVVHEQAELRVPLEHARRDRLDRGAVGDVARLVLVGVGRGAAREPDDVPAAGAQRAAECRADPRRGSRDDRDAHRARL